MKTIIAASTVAAGACVGAVIALSMHGHDQTRTHTVIRPAGAEVSVTTTVVVRTVAPAHVAAPAAVDVTPIDTPTPTPTIAPDPITSTAKEPDPVIEQTPTTDPAPVKVSPSDVTEDRPSAGDDGIVRKPAPTVEAKVPAPKAPPQPEPLPTSSD